MPGGVLISGASSGIGRATALRLARDGFRVFAGVRKDEDAERLREEAGGALTPVRLELTDGDAVAAAAEEVRAAVGDEGLAGLVNNAGVTVLGPLEFLPVDEFRRQLEINLVGHLALTQATLPMLRAARGRVVNISSIGGLRGVPFLGPYNASKFALEGMSDSLRQELRRQGVAVVLVEPGSIKTPIWEKGAAAGEAMRERLPADGERLYGRGVDAMLRAGVRTGERGIPAERVAAVVARALTAGRPRARYMVGVDARIQLALRRLLSSRANDWLVARVTGT